MDFSLMFWGDLEQNSDYRDKYRLLLDVVRQADADGYSAVWIPERHFHPWGGLYPNPSVLGAAVATCTTRIRIRAGSVVFPLHHPVRIAEEWSVVDNLSGGRVEIAAATGWREEDFVLAPDRFANRRSQIWDDLDLVRDLWRGGTWEGKTPSGVPAAVTIHPRPLQPELPVWITSAGGLRTICDAGESGFNLLTHLLGQEFDGLAAKIAQYRAYRVRSGLRTSGKVALMLHTLLGSDLATVRQIVHGPFTAYLKHSADLSIPAEHRSEWSRLEESRKQQIVEAAFDRYLAASLIGTPETCFPLIERVARMGVTEICCLIDFGVAPALVLEGLAHLTRFKEKVASGDGASSSQRTRPSP